MIGRAVLPYVLFFGWLAALIVALWGAPAHAAGSELASPAPVVSPAPAPAERQIVVGGAWWRYCLLKQRNACNARARYVGLRRSLGLEYRIARVPRRPVGFVLADWRRFGARCRRLARVYERRFGVLRHRFADPVWVGRQLAAQRGWTGGQWSALYTLWRYESGWRVGAANPSGAYGIPQALPGSKMAAYGADWRTNPATQIRWGLAYVAGRYGTPAAALAHFYAYHWY